MIIIFKKAAYNRVRVEHFEEKSSKIYHLFADGASCRFGAAFRLEF